MTPFAILAPGLDEMQTKLLRAALTSCRLPWTVPLDALSNTRYVLSVGRDALDVWHDFGLIRVTHNHGDVFTHTHPTTDRGYTIMVIEHPAGLQQMAWAGNLHRENMTRDLKRWLQVVTAGTTGFFPGLCGGCLKLREVRSRPAEFWVDELDGVGLCDDHYRRRARYNRRRKVIAVKDRGKTEHQIDGQLEMLPGDGTKVMVSKT